MTFSFSFIALAKSKAAWLRCNGILSKEKKKEKLTLIKLISSMILAASKEQTLIEFKRSTSSAKLHSTITFEKLILWQNNNANLITLRSVQREFKFFWTRWHDAAKTPTFIVPYQKTKAHSIARFLLRNCQVEFVNWIKNLELSPCCLEFSNLNIPLLHFHKL